MGEHEQLIQKVMAYVPQAQGMNFAEMMALSKQQGGGFGEGGQGMFFLLFLLLLTGRNGGGLFGGGGTDAAQVAQAGLNRSDFQILVEQLNGLQSTSVQGFAGLNTVIQDSRYQTAAAISTLGSSIQTQFSTMATQLASCCCQIERGLDQVSAKIDSSACATREAIAAATQALASQATQNQFTNIQNFSELKFQQATDKCEILRAIADSNAVIVNKLNQDRYQDLEAENTSLKLKLSQEQQTAAIVAALGKKTA